MGDLFLFGDVDVYMLYYFVLMKIYMLVNKNEVDVKFLFDLVFVKCLVEEFYDFFKDFY